MKKLLKRYIYILPVVLILILNIVPLSSFADSYNGVEGLTRPADYSKDLSNLSGSDFGFGDDKPYIVMRYNGYRFTYIAVQCQGEYSYEDNDGVYTFVFTEVYSCYGRTDGGRWTSWDDGWTHYWSTFTIIYDSNQQKLLRNDLPYGSFGSDVTSFEFSDNLKNSFNVTCTFRPDLNTDIDRKITSNGEIGLSQTFSMTVENKTNKNAQYRMTIYDEEDGDKPIFYYCSNEWVYSFDIKESTYSSSSVFGEHKVVLQHKPSLVHLVTGNTTDTQIFKWSQIPFKEKHIYRVSVDAVLIDLDMASEITNGAGDIELDFSEGDSIHIGNGSKYKYPIEDYTNIYSGLFSVNNLEGVSYNPNDTTNGVITATPDNIESLLMSRLAVRDTEGNIDFNNYSAFNDPNSPYNKNGNGSNQVHFNNTNSAASFGGSSITGTFSSAMNFIVSVFGFFPSQYLSLFLLGFATIIVIGVVKAVNK